MRPSAQAPAFGWRAACLDWIAALAVVALWLVSRPYRGVRHDATLYTGQVLARLMPDRVGQDLFFAYGSQDKYSLYSFLMTPLIERFGIGGTELVVLTLCNVLFVLACWQLMRPWFARPLRWVALMFIVVLPHTYGGLGAVSYAEPFLTARSMAEPLALFALAQVLEGRLYRAILLAVLAAVFHPLIVLPVLVIGWFALVMQERRWLWAGLLFLLVLPLGALGVHPFDGLFQRFDAAWWDAIRGPNERVFAKAYGVLDWSALLFDVLALATCLAGAVAGPALTRLIKATLAAAAAFTVLWVVGADLLHDVLLTQLQLWRAHWMLHLLGVMVLPLLGLHYWRRGWVGRWCIAALALAGVAVLSNWPTGWLCVAWAVIAVAVERARAQVDDRAAMLAAVASAAGAIGISLKVASVTLLATSASPDRFADVGPVMVILGLPLVAALLSLAIVRLLGQGRQGALIAGLMVLAGVVFGLCVYDQRSPWQRRLEAGSEAGPPVFEAALPAAASVYWDYDLVTPWLLARRGNFYSSYAGAGLLFNRDTALEFARRARTLAPVDLQHELCGAVSMVASRRHDASTAAQAAAACTFTRATVQGVCRAAVHPDYLVFGFRLVDVPVIAEWHDATPAAGSERHAFYLYSCASLS